MSDRLVLNTSLLALSFCPYLSELLTTQPTTRTRPPSRKPLPLPAATPRQTQPGSPQPSFVKQEIDCAGPSLCFRWEAIVIFRLKSCPPFNGRARYGSFSPLVLSYLAGAPPTPQLQKHLDFCTYLALPSALTSSVFLPSRHVTGIHSPVSVRTTPDLLHLRH